MKNKLGIPTKVTNIVFSIIPKTYWVVFLILSFLSFFPENFIILTRVGFNVLFFLVCTTFAIVVHETGHLVMAKAVGGTPRRLEFGRGHHVAKTKIFGVKAILNSNFNAGFAYAAFDDLKLIRMKLLVYTFGGILFNLSVAALCLFVLPFSIDPTQKLQVVAVLGITNLLCGLYALFPYYVNHQGLRLASDGLALFKIPFYKKNKLIELSSVSQLLDAIEYLEEKRYDESLAIFEQFTKKTEGSKLGNLNVSLVHLKLGNFQKSYDLIIELLPEVKKEQNEYQKGLFYNNLAWTCLVLNKLKEADKYSKLAIVKHQNTTFVRGTRGSVLIEIGQVALGKQILMRDVDFKFPNSHTLAASMYIALACHKLNNPEESKKYLQFVEDHVHELDLDEKVLYDRIVSRLNNV